MISNTVHIRMDDVSLVPPSLYSSIHLHRQPNNNWSNSVYGELSIRLSYHTLYTFLNSQNSLGPPQKLSAKKFH